MSIEKLTSAIIEYAQNKVQEIKKQFDDEIQEINIATQQEIQQLSQENNNLINRQATLIQTRLISNAQLNSQQEILKTKRAVIDDIFEQAKNKFFASESYVTFLKDIISQSIDSTSDLPVSEQDINKLKKIFPDLKYSVDKNLNGGIITRKGRIELNYSIDKIFNSVKNELIIDLSKLLFE